MIRPAAVPGLRMRPVRVSTRGDALPRRHHARGRERIAGNVEWLIAFLDAIDGDQDDHGAGDQDGCEAGDDDPQMRGSVQGGCFALGDAADAEPSSGEDSDGHYLVPAPGHGLPGGWGGQA